MSRGGPADGPVPLYCPDNPTGQGCDPVDPRECVSDVVRRIEAGRSIHPAEVLGASDLALKLRQWADVEVLRKHMAAEARR